jgi:hypothetical protein
MIGVPRFIIIYGIHQDSSGGRACLKVVETATRLLEASGSSVPIIFVDNKLIAVIAVKGDSVFLFHTGKGEDVSDTIWMVPHLAIARKIADQVSGSHAGVAVDLHTRIRLSDIGQQLLIVEDVDSALVIEENPCLGHGSSWLIKEDTPVG